MPQRRWQWLVKQIFDLGGEVCVIAPNPQNIEASKNKAGFVRRLKLLFASPQPEHRLGGELVYRSSFVPANHSLTSRVVNQASVAIGQSISLLRLSKQGALRDVGLVIGTVPALPTAGVAVLAARLAGAKLTIDLRDAWPDLLKFSDQWNKTVGKKSLRERIFSLGPRQLVVRLASAALTTILENADGVMVTSSLLEKSINERFPKMQHRCVTVRNVFPTVSEASYLRSAKKEPTSLNILYAGTVGRAQNLINAVQAVMILRRAGRDIHLHVVGEGAGVERLQKVAATCPDVITVSDRVPRDELHSLYEWADTALVHLTDWGPLKMAVPSKIYELLELGIHISAVAEGETAEIVERLDAGFVVPPESPELLAKEWEKLVFYSEMPNAVEKGRAWVMDVRERVAPQAFQKHLQSYEVAKWT